MQRKMSSGVRRLSSKGWATKQQVLEGTGFEDVGGVGSLSSSAGKK